MKTLFKKICFCLVTISLLLSLASCSEETNNATKVTNADQNSVDTTTKKDDKKESTVAKIGETLQGDNWKMTFLDAKTYKTAPSDNEYFNDTAKDGKVYLFLFIEAENISDNAESLAFTFGSSGYVDGYKTSSTFVTAVFDDYNTLDGTVEPGRKLKGYIAFEIDENWKEFELVYTDGLLSTSFKYTFKVTSTEIAE